jgi:hypothetical protein
MHIECSHLVVGTVELNVVIVIFELLVNGLNHSLRCLCDIGIRDHGRKRSASLRVVRIDPVYVVCMYVLESVYICVYLLSELRMCIRYVCVSHTSTHGNFVSLQLA